MEVEDEGAGGGTLEEVGPFIRQARQSGVFTATPEAGESSPEVPRRSRRNESECNWQNTTRFVMKRNSMILLTSQAEGRRLQVAWGVGRRWGVLCCWSNSGLGSERPHLSQTQKLRCSKKYDKISYKPQPKSPHSKSI
jgi:hypothetical protein